jgi:hypothetical protein
MTVTNLEDALHKRPFTPFEVHIDNGKTVHVCHPDYFLFSKSKRTAIIVEDEHFHIVDLDHISSLSAPLK